MEDVADGGTIEILYKAEPYIFPKTVIDKDVRIIGVVGDNGKLPTINFSGIGSPAIQVESPNFFHMENITLCFQSYETLIESRTRNICLNNITTNYSYPIVISEPINSNEIDATIANCTFNSFAPKIEFTTLVTGSISFSNNSFSTTSLIINNTGADISIFSNRFLNSGIVNESNTTGIITVEDNSFEGMRCIINSSSSAGIIINRNRFISDNRYIYNNDSTSDLNLCGNWWDNINGPMGSDSLIELSGNIDYSNWALDEQCTVFLNKEVPPDEVFVDKEYTVKNSGDYVWDYQAFNNITDAISRVSDGGTVHISFGEYNESLILDKCVYLAGSIDNPPIITTTDDSIINITADNVELNNLKLDGKNSVLTAVNGENINSLTINSIEISNVVSSSISLNNISGYILIDSCSIYDSYSGTGIFINGSSSAEISIQNSLFTGLDKGIVLEEVYKENNMVVNIGSINSPNIFSNNNYYIYLNDFNDDINAIDNNWNTDSIEDMLYHYLDDNSLGKVIYLPETDISGKALLKNSFCHSDIKVDLLYSGNIIDSTYTDVYGNFSFNNILLNVYTLSFEYENYETVEQEIEVTNEGVEVNVELIYDFNLFDVNNDGILNEADLYSTAGYFGTSIEDDLWNVIYDFNRNGRIDILDLMMILRMGDE